MAYFILKGSVAAGYIKDDDYVIASYLQEDDFFGEVATRTVYIITEEGSEFLIIPSKVMRQLVKQHHRLRQVFYTTMAQRLSKIELPRGTGMDQELLRELRTDIEDD